MLNKEAQEAVAEKAAEVASTFGLAPGVKPENVQRRVASLVAHGCDPLAARAFAIEAEGTQVAKDGQTVKERETAEEDARAAVGQKLTRMTKAELFSFAEKNGIAIGQDAITNAQVLTVIQAALEAAK